MCVYVVGRYLEVSFLPHTAYSILRNPVKCRQKGEQESPWVGEQWSKRSHPYPQLSGFMDRPPAVPESEDQILMLALPVTSQVIPDKGLNFCATVFSSGLNGSDVLISKDTREDTVFKCQV